MAGQGPIDQTPSVITDEDFSSGGTAVRIASVAALGGFLFGYDSAVINGAVASIQNHFGIDNYALGFAVASALLGAAAGAMTAGRIADRIGRISVMKIAAVLFFISAFGTGLANSVWMIVLFRIVGGIGVGVASVIAPAYIAETSPPRIRGRLGSLQQLAIVTGIFLSLAVDYTLAHIAGGASKDLWLGLEAWRWMFLVMAIPAVVYGTLAFTIPESPRYLVASHKIPEARKVLTMLLGEKNLEITISRIQETLEREDKPSWRDLRKPTGGLYAIVWVGVGLSVFQQFVGINVIFYYSNVLWEAVGFDESSSFVITVITSVVNILTTLIAIGLIDKIGRKPLLLIGSYRHGGLAGDDGDHLRHRATRRWQAESGRRCRTDRTDRGERLRHRVRHVVGSGRLGAARRDVPQPHPGSRTWPCCRCAVGSQLGDHRFVPATARTTSGLPMASTPYARFCPDSSCGSGSWRPRVCRWRTCTPRSCTRTRPPKPERPASGDVGVLPARPGCREREALAGLVAGA